ncbi:two component transcriptional regulator, LuxR family [Pseudonocardia ammonioxydans]|uniref:Two component transcriptional regulator, LuxR family n=1 Tax=Pseudonocardia ammonioxydans TaxID=260086 RepID=A0A1I4SAG7_PSUAM|nr:response regulator transcription factor [Pseudonocardia ammonioxydans]SFM61290.1 two component transcriptional regulator, LuxR family [Pseudonocardia ammonioxydans]
MTGPVVLLVDDHPVVREGLRSVLAAAGVVVAGEAGDAEAAVRLAREHRPDVVLMDLRLPGRSGLEATADIVAAGAARVLVLTTFDTDADVLRAIEAGAVGYLLKDTPSEQLVAGVRAAAAGATVLGPEAADRLARAVRAPRPPALTAREEQVLHGVARGASNPQIARELAIGEATVKSHLIRVFEKLQVDDRTSAVVAALRLGLLQLPDP